VAEIFQGLRRERERQAIQRSFQDLLFLEPSGMEVYLHAARLYRSLWKRGVTVRSTVDCIIATLAEEADCALLARDSDMEAILDSGLLRVDRWPNA
jgi:predicted nucleic acid-binding protein